MLKTRDIPDSLAVCLGVHDSLPGSFWTYALEQLSAIRQAKTYKPYWLRLPEDKELQISGYGTYEYQAHFKPGTWIYGLQFLDTTTGNALSQDPGRLSLQITETYSGLPLLSEFEDVNVFRLLRNGDSRTPCIFWLTSPLVIPAPGDVDIEVCNLTSQSIYWQLAILAAEPYDEVAA